MELNLYTLSVFAKEFSVFTTDSSIDFASFTLLFARPEIVPAKSDAANRIFFHDLINFNVNCLAKIKFNF